MVVDRNSGIRIPPTSAANSLRKCTIQLGFFDAIRDNMIMTGANGPAAPLLPDQEGGISSLMASSNFTIPAQVPARPTYAQAWSIYNLAATNEKERFLPLLKDVCATIPQSPLFVGTTILFADTYLMTPATVDYLQTVPSSAAF